MDSSSLLSISQLLQSHLLCDLPHKLAKRIANRVVDERRKSLLSGVEPSISIEDHLIEAMTFFQKRKLRRVINATGIIVHTNLGRAPLADEVVSNIREVAAGYANLELHLDDGKKRRSS